MAPKKKGKSKEELEAERLRAEEEAAKAEEERIKAEQEEAKRQRELALERERIAAEARAAEAELLKAEQASELAHRTECKNLHAASVQSADEKGAWERYISCVPRPDPQVPSQIADYLTLQRTHRLQALEGTLHDVLDTLAVIDETSGVALQAAQRDESDELARLQACKADLFALIAEQLDAFTLWFLNHCDRFASVEGDIKRELSLGRARWATWLNVNKNPRLKSIEFPKIGLQLDIHKQLALAPIAIRAELLDAASKYAECSQGEWYPVGPVLTVELLALPAMAKPTANEWTMRLEGAGANRLHRLPYPIPPAGGDASTWQSDDDVPAIGFNTDVAPALVEMAGASLQVGMWDALSGQWTSDHVSGVALANGKLSFKATRLAPFAVVCSRAALLPYSSWSLRPAGGDGGDAAVLTVDVGVSGMPVSFEVGRGSVTLRGPDLAPLAHLLGVAMQPVELLAALARAGMFLAPSERDAEAADVVAKDADTERAMCRDVASLAGSHLIASSKWTQYVEADECICRISEVTDWEQGGRTGRADADRVFYTEAERGAGRVAAVLRTGTRGVAFRPALNRCVEYPAVPEYQDERRKTCVWGEVHASLLQLIRGEFQATLEDEVVVEMAAAEELESKRRAAENKRLAELEEYAKRGEKLPEELLEPAVMARPERPLYWPTDWPATAAALRPAAGTVERALAFSALTCETLAQLMYTMRLFSFSVG